MMQYLLLLLINLSLFNLNGWESTTHDFGTIQKLDEVTHEFKYQNTTDEDITIDYVRVTCSCTEVEWTQDIIKSGEYGTISATYIATRRKSFNKPIMVFLSNQKKWTTLRIMGKVE